MCDSSLKKTSLASFFFFNLKPDLSLQQKEKSLNDEAQAIIGRYQTSTSSKNICVYWEKYICCKFQSTATYLLLQLG